MQSLFTCDNNSEYILDSYTVCYPPFRMYFHALKNALPEQRIKMHYSLLQHKFSTQFKYVKIEYAFLNNKKHRLECEKY